MDVDQIAFQRLQRFLQGYIVVIAKKMLALLFSQWEYPILKVDLKSAFNKYWLLRPFFLNVFSSNFVDYSVESHFNRHEKPLADIDSNGAQ